MKKSTGLVICAVAAVAVAAGWMFSPSIRTQMNREFESWGEWTDDVRRADPDGFVKHVEAVIAEEIDQLKAVRHELIAAVDEASQEEKKNRALCEHAQLLAAEFRTAYQDAEFPVAIRGGAYTEQEMDAQVSSLLAEVQGYEQSIQAMESVKRDASKRLERCVVQINKNESQLKILRTQAALLKAERLTEEGERLLSQVDAMRSDTHEVLQGAPRTVEELMVHEQRPIEHNLSAAEAFLAKKPRQRQNKVARH